MTHAPTSKCFQQICCDCAKSRLQVLPPPPAPLKFTLALVADVAPQAPRRKRHVLAVTTKGHAYHRCNRVARIHVLKILYSLERAGTEWPVALLWGSTPSGHSCLDLHRDKRIHRRPSGAKADRVALRRHSCRQIPYSGTNASRPARRRALHQPATCDAARPVRIT